MMKLTKYQLKSQHKDDEARFNQIKGVMVISAKHMHHYWHKHKPMGLFATHHVYSWRVTNRTHNLRWAKAGHLAKVIDKQGKENHVVIITKVTDMTGSIAKKMANKLEPVINFRDQVLKNGQIKKESK